jgi:hypothetical protein
MKELIRHILQEDVNRKLLKPIKNYVNGFIQHIDELKGEVCEVLVQMDGDVIVIDLYVNDEYYRFLDQEYSWYYVSRKMEYTISQTFGIKRNKLITYIEKCSTKREYYD